MRKITHLVGLIAVSLVMGACQGRGLSGTPTTSPPLLDNSTDPWLSKWDGPEGTYLLLTKHENTYLIKIQSLDGPTNYEGVSVRDTIQFKRNGNIESIHAGSGADTGMKWLLEKKNCLIIKAGEGFCM